MTSVRDAKKYVKDCRAALDVVRSLGITTWELHAFDIADGLGADATETVCELRREGDETAVVTEEDELDAQEESAVDDARELAVDFWRDVREAHAVIKVAR